MARRLHGGRVSLSQCAEMVAAEVLSALPIDPEVADAAESDGAEVRTVAESLHHRADGCGPEDRYGIAAGARNPCGLDDPENRVTLCAFHHLRGVHAGLVRCTGRGPDGLQIALGVRPHQTSLAVYASGDRLLFRTVLDQPLKPIRSCPS